ncbi:hypothetical protein DFP73DRAFT_61057 [Morchella snyderi]|nr:hypothetical protein DFP73DRAFT_61057 [Morchella snyderi]
MKAIITTTSNSCNNFYVTVFIFRFFTSLSGISIQQPPTMGDECMDFGARELKGVSFIVLFYIKNSFFLHSGLGDFFGRFLCLVRFLFWFLWGAVMSVRLVWQLGGLIFIAYCLFLVYILSFSLLLHILYFLFICVVSSSTSSQTDMPTYSNIYFSSLCFSSLFVIWISRSDI